MARSLPGVVDHPARARIRTASPKARRRLCWGLGRSPSLGSGLALQALLEPLDLSGSIDDVLRPREERVAVRADVDAKLLAGRAHRPLSPAGTAVNLCLVILGMDIGLHVKHLLRRRPRWAVGPAGGRRQCGCG